VQIVRRRILEILKRRKSATVGELARHLEMAPVSVRYHLDILQGDNLIQISKVRHEGSVGRPKQLYSLTKEADEYFPDNFAPLTAGLVNQMKKALAPAQVEAVFCALADEMAREFLQDAEGDQNFEERLVHISEFLNERGYLARWEKVTIADPGGSDRDSYLLHTFNCPYAGVSSEHRELCQMDLELMKKIVGQCCRRVDSLAEAGRCCTYQIQVDATHSDESVSTFDIPLIGN
jgi:predicted ArsR family transcriptional regulator